MCERTPSKKTMAILNLGAKFECGWGISESEL